MLQGVITRGTTASLIFPLNTKEQIVLYSISYNQKGSNILIQKGESIADGVITTELTPDDTLLFNPAVKFVEVQIKGITNNNKTKILGKYKYRLEDVFDELPLED